MLVDGLTWLVVAIRRVPMCVRWTDVFKPGTIVNDTCAHEDLISTFAAAHSRPTGHHGRERLRYPFLGGQE